MATIARTVEEHPKVVAAAVAAIILFFLAPCIFHDAIRIRHWLFRCDHRMH